VVVLDVTVVNVALPHIQTDLRFSDSSLTWVVNAYTLVFGGFLLLGGRVADLLGRRRIFMVGLALFGLTSLGGGLATSSGLLIGFRAVQGLGAAMLSPAALSILTVTYRAHRERNIAMGVWGGLAGLGGTLGVVAGGLLVDTLNWRWVFFINVPIALVLVLLAPRFIGETRIAATGTGMRGFDLPGAALATAGTLALVLGVIRAEPKGWNSGQVLGLLAAGVALLVAFVTVEARARQPLVPPRLFRDRGLSVASASLVIDGAMFLAMFFQTALFLQQARGLNALNTGVAFLPMGVAAILGALAATSLVSRVGTRTVQVGAGLLSVAGILLLAQAGTADSYAAHLLPGLVLCGIGFIGLGVPANITAATGLSHEHAGSGSGVVTAGNQIGGAIGLAVVSTLATSHITHLLVAGSTAQAALVGGYHRGLTVVAAFALAATLVSLIAPQLRPTPEEAAAAAAA
jgi:EmrB/QacA subfamily drug resistance transporter